MQAQEPLKDLDEKTKRALAKSVAKEGSNPARHAGRIEKRHPDKAVAVLERLVRGETYNRIQREVGVDWDTIVALKSRHLKALEQRRESVAMDAMDMMEAVRLLQMEKMRLLSQDEAALKRVNLRDLAMSYGIYGDKFFQASEGNRMVIEHKSGAPSIEDAQKAIAEARSKLKKGSVEVVVEELKEGK